MIDITDKTIERVRQQREKTGKPGLNLRVMVDSGGCSGFQYRFSWDETVNADDDILEDCVAVDAVSLPFMKGSRVDFISGLMGSDFKVDNPNAASGCGCGHSFAVKT